MASAARHAWMRPFYAVGALLMGVGVRLLPSVMTRPPRWARTSKLALVAMEAPPAVVENAGINRAPGYRHFGAA